MFFCDFLLWSLLRSLYVFFLNMDACSIYYCATLFVVLPLCSCLCNVILRSLLSITQYSFLHAACLFLLSVFFSLCRYLCFCICASLLHSVSSHPLPTHTQCPCTVGSIRTCAQKHSRQLVFFMPASHLAALYSSYPRRGLTAGNINRMACSDIEDTLVHNSRTHMQTHHTHCSY